MINKFNPPKNLNNQSWQNLGLRKSLQNKSFNDYLKSNFNNYFLWIANYNKVESPLENMNWKMWQFSDNGSVNGIKGPVDLDLYKGSFSELKKYALK